MVERYSDLDKTILVGNIHSCVTEEILFELFLQAGPVEKVHIFRDGHHRPYGCVYYKHAEAVPYAVELLNGIWLYGQPIKLQCKVGGYYQSYDMRFGNLENGVIANSKDVVLRGNMDLNCNDSPGLKNRSNEAHGWSNMVHNRAPDMCSSVVPPVVWYCPPLQQWMNSGYPPWTSYMEENSLLFRSDNTTVDCAKVSLEGNKLGIAETICSPNGKLKCKSYFAGSDSH